MLSVGELSFTAYRILYATHCIQFHTHVIYVIQMKYIKPTFDFGIRVSEIKPSLHQSLQITCCEVCMCVLEQ